MDTAAVAPVAATVAPERATSADVAPAAMERPVAASSAGELWARVLRGQGITAVLRTVLSNLRVESLDAAAGRVTLAGELKYAESARARQALIADAFRRELGRSVELVIRGDEPEAGPQVDASGDTGTDLDGAAGEQPVESRTDAASAEPASPARAGDAAAAKAPALPSEHPLVKEAMELFGARIVDVQHRRPA